MKKQARERARAEAEEVQARLAERAQTEADTGKKVGGRPPVAPDPDTAKPDSKSQRNFTDPDSRIRKDGATKAFAQAHNAQAAADSAHQIIVVTGALKPPESGETRTYSHASWRTHSGLCSA